MADDELISIGRVARILGLSSQWIHSRLQSALSPVTAANGRRWYRLSVVERYAAQRDARKGKR